MKLELVGGTLSRFEDYKRSALHFGSWYETCMSRMTQRCLICPASTGPISVSAAEQMTLRVAEVFKLFSIRDRRAELGSALGLQGLLQNSLGTLRGIVPAERECATACGATKSLGRLGARQQV